jgi:adenylate cyclase
MMMGPLNKWFKPLLWVAMCLMATAVASCSENRARHPMPTAVRGVLDLRNWDLNLQGPVKLDGQWEFHWNRLMDPKSLSKDNAPGIKDFQALPGIWNGQVVHGHKLSGQGYATYRLQVLLKPPQEMMALKFMSLSTAFSFFVNGHNVASSGLVGQTRETSKPEWQPQVADFFCKTDHLDLVLQVSNFHHRKGGAPESIWLGREPDIWEMREKSLAFQLFLCGSIFIMGLYHLGLFMLRKKDRAYLYFGFFSLLIALYSLLAGERYFLHLFPAVDWEWRVKLTNLSSFLSVPFFLLFIQALFPKDSWKRATGLLAGAIGVLALSILVSPATVYTQTIPLFHILTLVSGIYILFVFSLAIRRRRNEAGLILSGVLIILAAVVNDILYDNAVIHTGQSIYLGFFLFIFIESFSLSLRFAKAFETIENQSQALAKKNQEIQREMVERRRVEDALRENETKLQTILDSVFTGIIVIDIETHLIVDVNPLACNTIGETKEKIIGSICHSYICPAEKGKCPVTDLGQELTIPNAS